MSPVQSTYSENIQAPPPGVISSSDYDTTTGNVETEAGIGFGLAVSVGTVATFGDKATVLGGTLDKFKGISVRDIAALNTQADPDKYAQYANMAIVRRGTVWVSPVQAVVADDPVFFDGATGRFGNTNASGKLGPIKGARWISSADADGRAEVYVPGLANAADV